MAGGGGGSGGSKSNEQPSVNTAPVLDNAIADVVIDENATLNLTIADTFSDPDRNDRLTYTASLVDAMGVLLGSGNLPNWLTFDATTRTFSGVPRDADVGVIYVRVTASDGSLSAVDNFSITVNDVNNTPVLDNAIADVVIDENATLNLVIPLDTFSDPDKNDTLTYTAHLVDAMGVLLGSGNLPTWLHFNASTRTFSGVPRDADVGQIYVRVTATDTGNLSVSDDFRISVDNLIRGTSGNDYLWGTYEADRMYGYEGNDKIAGVEGDDHIYGGSGDDELGGGRGKDTFYYTDIHDGTDIITDFYEGNGFYPGTTIPSDVIDLSALLNYSQVHLITLIQGIMIPWYSTSVRASTLEIDVDGDSVTDLTIHLIKLDNTDLNTLIADGNIVLS